MTVWYTTGTSVNREVRILFCQNIFLEGKVRLILHLTCLACLG